MSFKRRVGNFLILFGLVSFLVFAASLLAPKGGFDVPWFLAAVVLLAVGVNFRLSKSGDGPLVTRASSPPAAKAGPPSGGKPGGGKPGGGGKGGPPKKQSMGNKIMKGPADKRLPPKPAPGGGGGGKPPAGKKK
jgi:hypothetical protein